VQTRATERPDATHKDRRLRAVYRRELQNSVYYSSLLVGAGITAAATAGIFMASSPAVALALQLPLALITVGVASSARRRGRRYAIPLGMLVGLLPVVSISLSVALLPGLRATAMGCLGLVPLAFAIFIPLERRIHIVWLIMASLAMLVAVVATWQIAADTGLAIAGAVSGALGSVTSLAANDIQLRRRLQMDGQLLAVRGLYGRMKEHEVDLRRQDEFLLMQQETLVVQQAELLRLNEELEAIARLDALTGLGNRLRLNEDLAGLAARIERHGGTAGVLLMDLDRFKRLNDCTGHLAGDAALRGVADVLKKTSRSGDGVYRYGGEEFLVLLHDCDEAGLEVAGQRYLTAIESAGMAHPDNPPYGCVTASAGATELSKAFADVDSALHNADEALYVAKETGRNRLYIHRREAPATLVPMTRQRAAS